jgi:hypothetical protein
MACLEKENCIWIIEYKIKKENTLKIPVGPDILFLIVGIAVPVITGSGWGASKLLNNFYLRIERLRKRIDDLDDHINSMYHKMPIEYVLKVDFIREIQQMQDNFKQVNMKLDKLIEKL